MNDDSIKPLNETEKPITPSRWLTKITIYTNVFAMVIIFSMLTLAQKKIGLDLFEPSEQAVKLRPSG